MCSCAYTCTEHSGAEPQSRSGVQWIWSACCYHNFDHNFEPTLRMFDAIEMIVLIVCVWSYRNNGTSFGISLRRPRIVTSWQWLFTTSGDQAQEKGSENTLDRDNAMFCGPGRRLERENTWFCGPGRTLERENTWFCGSGREEGAGDLTSVDATPRGQIFI